MHDPGRCHCQNVVDPVSGEVVATVCLPYVLTVEEQAALAGMIRSGRSVFAMLPEERRVRLRLLSEPGS